MEDVASRKHSAPYGQACVNCAKAKCRCLVHEGSTGCERCHRLEKTCIPSGTARKRIARTKTTKNSKIEEKLDDLVSLLRTQNVVPTTLSPATSSLPTPHSDHSLRGATSECEAEILNDEDLLDFRKNYLAQFPFVLIPPGTTAEQLQLEHPVFSMAIHTICTKAASRQKKLAKHIRETLASQIVVDCERSYDLLLSVVVCITWSTYITHGKKFLGVMSGLARSLVSDLRLDKPLNSSGCPTIGPQVEVGEDRTNQGSRLLLTVFALSASISTMFRLDFMPWSPQIEEACIKLTNDMEAEGDLLLVTVARITRITLNAAEIACRASDDAFFARYVVPTISPLEQALNSIKDTLTVEQLQHSLITGYICGAEIVVHELALLQPPAPALTYQSTVDHKRIASLSSCLQTSKACTDAFREADITSLPTPSMLIFTYSLRVLFKLCTLQDPAWDTGLVQAGVDIFNTIMECAASTERANTRIKDRIGEDSVLGAAAEVMRQTAPGWRLPEQERVGDAAVTMGEWSGGEGMDMSMEFLDEFWLQGSLSM